MVNVQLSSDEALVLFELLSRNEANLARPVGEHSAEEHALEIVLRKLEKELVEPFKSNYRELVAQARSRVVEKYGE